MIKNQLFIAAALLVGVAIGYFMKSDAPSEDVKTADDAICVAKSKIADVGESASVNALRARIAELEKQLVAKNKEKAVAQVAKVKQHDAVQGERHGPPSMKDMREHMEKMAKENPEQFAKMTNTMARWRQRRIERAHSKLDLLSSVDTSAMTAEQKAAHEKFQDLLVRREELVEKMQNPEMTDEDREDIMREMHETGRAMREAATQERETLISQTVQSLGYSGDDAAEVSDTISEIISVTETHGEGPGGGPGGPGGPGGAGGPPSGGAGGATNR